ncbi:hypothetical protein PANDA_014973 [Ailuropoda melanoleuca]|uniref:Uncharacterized protein n=1 Tax=Ailuropoda melanoleuca TaxID=9646 RepID=D2HSC4_AILME|nr:hypothetical protein PANDA_014973 [Ailuropoda melanoleuca]
MRAPCSYLAFSLQLRAAATRGRAEERREAAPEAPNRKNVKKKEGQPLLSTATSMWQLCLPAVASCRPRVRRALRPGQKLLPSASLCPERTRPDGSRASQAPSPPSAPPRQPPFHLRVSGGRRVIPWIHIHTFGASPNNSPYSGDLTLFRTQNRADTHLTSDPRYARRDPHPCLTPLEQAVSPRGENNDYFNSRQGLECNKPRIREAIAQAKRFLALRTARPKLEANIRSAVVRPSRKAAFDQDVCLDGLSEDQVRRLAVRVKAEKRGRGRERGRLLGQGELLLGSLLLP